MRTYLRGKATLLFMTLGLLIAIPAVALADTITADPDPADIVVVENNVNKAPGETGTAKVWLAVDDNSTDPVNGCNAATGTPVSITLSSTNPDDVTFDSSGTKANPASLTACGSAAGKEIGYTVSSSATGPFPKTVTVTASGSGGRTTTTGGPSGTTNTPAYTSDTFTVTITAPPDSTAPTTSATATKATSPVSSYTFGDWSNKDVTVTLNATDTGGTGVNETRYTLDGTDPTTTNGTVYSAPFTVSTEGTKTLKFRSWDKATPPNAEAVQSQTIKIDKTNPTFSCPTADSDWHATNPTFNCTASGGDSGLTPTSDSSFSLSTNVADGSEDSNASTGTKTLTDGAGNTVTAGPITGVKIDRKAPTFSCPADDGTWHATNPTFNCTAADGGSGLTPTSDSSFSLSTSVADGSENNNASTGDKVLTDGVGHTTTAGPITGVKVDRKAPNVQCGSADGNWHSGNVDIACTASDGGSGLADDANDSSFNLSTSVADGNETANASTNSRNVADAVGHSATAGPVSGNMVDRKAPSFESCPSGGPFLVNSGSHSVGPIDANDGGSLLNTANSTLSGSVNTSSTGTKQVVFTAKDNVGNQAQKTCDYDVNTHTFIGFSSPVDNPNYLNVMKAGQAVPLKWQLKDASGNPVTNLQSVTVTVKDTGCTIGTSTDQVEEYAAGSSSLQNLGGGYYQFNWKSPTSYAKSCKMLTVNGVGVQQSALFQFTK